MSAILHLIGPGKVLLATIGTAALMLTACSTTDTGRAEPAARLAQPSVRPSGLSNAGGESAKLTGIWKMIPLAVGIANVVEFTPAGESRLYSYNCITKDQQAPEFSRYAVDPGGEAIHIETSGISQTLKILLVNDAFLVLSQNVDGRNFNLQYRRGTDLSPMCGSEDRWEEERVKRVPYASSDFIPDPAIPPHPDLDRYAGRWATEKGEVQIEVKRVADGSYQLNLDANENWTHLYNAVRWESDGLHYTSFAYANRSDLFDHPFHKSSHKSVLGLAPNAATMKYAFFIGARKYDYLLTRK